MEREFSEWNEFKKERRDEAVNNTIDFLNKHNFNYTKSNISNVVILNPETNKVFLSLKKTKGFYKYRFDGDRKWNLCREKTLISKFSSNV